MILKPMTRQKIALFAVPVIAAMMISTGISAQLAAADPDGSNPNSAFIIRDLGCNLPDGEGNFVSADTDHSVITVSGKNNFRCQATVAPPSSGHAEVMRGFGCNTDLGFTTNTHSVVSDEGDATMTCHFRG